MKLFTKYAPVQVAKHITRFFKGEFYIHEIGYFRFDNAKLLPPSSPTHKHYQVLKEVSQEINKIRCPLI